MCILARMPVWLAGAIVFFTSAAVLVLEILAGRVLAPYVGVTLQTYTGIIGVILAGIALGSFYGGRLADRREPRALLGPIIALGGVLALASLPIVTVVGPLLASRDPVAIVLLAFVGFFAPATVLSAVTPTVVKIQLADLDHTGSVVGRLSALGTTGAIVGTFFTGFVLLAAFPTPPIVLAVGGTLAAAGMGLWWWLRPRAEHSAAPLLLAALVAAGLTAGIAGPCQVESAYFCARVVSDEERPSGRLLVLDTLMHSYVDLDDPTYLEFSYAQIMGDVLATVFPEGEPVKALHIGGGGFSLPRYLRATRPGSESLVLELDPTLVRLAQDELGLRRGPDLRVRVGDARLGLREQPDDAYDLVIGDAFGGLAVPWHLTTVEFVRGVRRTLRPNGIYALNLIDYPPLGFARAEAATLAAVFQHIAVIAPPARLAGREGGNFVLVGSDRPLPFAAIMGRNAERGDDDALVTDARLSDFVGDADVLTDAFAPVDQLLTTRPE